MVTKTNKMTSKIRAFFQDDTVKVILAMIGWFGGLTLAIYIFGV